MKERTLLARERTVRICSAIAVTLVGLLFMNIAVFSILQTCRFNSANPSSESIQFQNDSVITNLGLLTMTILGLLVLIRKNVHLSKVNTKLIICIMLVFSTVISYYWVTTAKTISGGETATMLTTAKEAAEGNYEQFTKPFTGDYNYYQFYPFQLGYVFFAELLVKIFGAPENDVFFQIPNIIALDFAYVALVMIAKRLFDRKAVTNMTAIALIVCFQPMLIATLTNGVLIGLALALWAVFCTLKFMQEDKLLFGGIAVLLITLSVIIKYTYMVVLIAIIIALVLHVIDKLKFISIALIALMILCPLGFRMILEQSYSDKSGTQLGSRVTNELYAYVGIGENENSPLYAGWFSFNGVTTLVSNELDEKAANQAAREAIDARRRELNEQGRMWEFYNTKLLSQINEPSFQSIWVSQVREHDFPEPTPEEPETFPKFVKSVYTGGISRLLDRWFNYYNMIIFIGFAAGMVWLFVKKKLNPGMTILPAAIFGGLLYHTICEAKSQFMLPFFVMLIPFAVYGILNSIQALNRVTDFLFHKNHSVVYDGSQEEPAA